MTEKCACGGVIFHFPRSAGHAIVTVFDHAFLSWQIHVTERVENNWIDLRTVNNPSSKRRQCIFHFRYYDFLWTNFDPSLCNNGQCIFSQGRMLHIHNINVSMRITMCSLCMSSHQIFRRNIMNWGPNAYVHDGTSVCSCQFTAVGSSYKFH